MRTTENMQHLERYDIVSRGKAGGQVSENGECSKSPPKWKKRKVPVVRDFPVGCGWNAPPPPPRPTEPVVSNDGACEQIVSNGNNDAPLDSDFIEGSKNDAKSPSPQPLEELVQIEVPENSTNVDVNSEEPRLLSNMVKESHGELSGNDSHTALENADLVTLQNPLNHEVSELSNNSPRAETTRPVNDTILSPRLFDLLKQPRSWNYPPRRKISAVRDFPPNCGPNAPPLSKEDCTKNGTVSDDFKEKGSDAENDDDLNINLDTLIGNIVSNNFGEKGETEPRDVSSEAIRNKFESDKSSELRINIKDKKAKATIVTCQNDVNQQPKLKSHKQANTSDVVVNVVAGKVDNEIVVYAGEVRGVAAQNNKEIVVYDDYHNVGDSSEDEQQEDFHVGYRSQSQPEYDVTLMPVGPSSSSGRDDNHDNIVTRNKVKETLRIFQQVCRKLLHEEEAKLKLGGIGLKRVDLAAAKIVKDRKKYVNTGKSIVGPVPGVEVGDEFHFRVELAIIGVHRPFQAGIDYVKQGGKIIATSVVASTSGGYGDVLDNSDVLTYTGSGGKDSDKQPEDQKLERGNLALKNSADKKTSVRVIRGFKETKASDSTETKGKVVSTFTYDGLYRVERYWQKRGPNDKLIYQFELVRIHGQPALAWNEVRKTKNLKVREGVRVPDISQGKEKMPICAINTIDDETPPEFEYITEMIYPNWCNPIPPKGCGCAVRCSEPDRCSCAVKNGEEIPYNRNGAIVEARPLVYECGPSCKCPRSCYNRVTQNGLKLQLEIFKTGSSGWGVRSLNSISSGSFICEYLGELLDDKEAEQRIGNDEYLFDIGHNFNDQTLYSEHASQSDISEIVEDGFTIDAAQYGNVGRFINHSCSPNLYAQNVLYDHEDRRMPHIMLFAVENIPPLQELTYHYNYTIDEVLDSHGNIRRKNCYCGSSECVGRMY